MNSQQINLLLLIIKTSIVHTVTYFIAGITAVILLDYGQSMGIGESIFKPISDPMVMAGPLLQPIRGVIFALAFYIVRHSIFGSKLGWLKLFWLLIALGVLSTFGPAPGSIEAIIYTNHEISISTYIEIVIQAFAFSALLCYWVKNNMKWLNWVMGTAFALAMLLPTLGLMVKP